MSFLGNRPDSFGYSSTSYDHFNGDGVTTVFTLSRTVSANSDIEVIVNNVVQDPGVAYYIINNPGVSTQLAFTGTPSVGTGNIAVIYRQFINAALGVSANSITAQSIAANTIQAYHLSSGLLNPIVNTFTGDNVTTSFTLSQAALSANSCLVTVNGITQNSPTNYSVNGTTLTFTSAPALSAVIRCSQQSIISTGVVPIDGSITTSKYAANSIPTSAFVANTIPTNAHIPNSITANLIVSVSNTTIVGLINSNQINTVANTQITGIIPVTSGGTGLSTVGTSGYFLQSNGTGLQYAAVSASGITGTLGVPNGGTGLTSLTAGYIPFGAGTSAFGSSSNLFWDNTNTRLGIGNSSPSTTLHVTGPILIGYNGSNEYLWFDSLSANAYIGRNTSTGDIGLSAAGGQNLTFAINAAEKMRITSAGNVGIGTTGPSWALTLGSGQISINPAALGDKLYTYNNTNYRYGIAIASGEHRLFAAGDGVTTIGNVSNDGSFTYTAKLTVQNAGYISMPYQPKFHATGNGTGSTTGGYFNFPSVYTNISSSYNSSTGKFTAPVAGTYYIYASVMASSGTGRFIWQFYKNGSSLNMNQGGGDSTNYDTWFGAITVTLAAGDYVQVYNTSGTPYNNSQEQNFGGWLIG